MKVYLRELESTCFNAVILLRDLYMADNQLVVCLDGSSWHSSITNPIGV